LFPAGASETTQLAIQISDPSSAPEKREPHKPSSPMYDNALRRYVTMLTGPPVEKVSPFALTVGTVEFYRK
jgi:hypothetical protein